MCERGVEVDHTTLLHWVQKYDPELDDLGLVMTPLEGAGLGHGDESE